jgi:hypothetical protein
VFPLSRPTTGPLLALLLLCGSCAVDKFPLPETFDVAFAVGEVCVPSQVATGDASMVYPVRFDLCRYRCIELDRSTARLYPVHSCALGMCKLTLLATATAHSKTDEKDCDARDLVDPPPSECEPERYDFFVPVPMSNGEAVTGQVPVYVPFLELEEGQDVIDRLSAGENPADVVREDVGFGGPPERQLNVEFGERFSPVLTHDGLTAGDCHPIESP